MPAPWQRRREAPGPGFLSFGYSLARWGRDPLTLFAWYQRRYGDMVRFPWPDPRVYLITHPDYVQHVLQDRHTNYGKQTFFYRIVRGALGQGLLTSEGELWRRERRLIQPAFHQQQVAKMESGIHERVEAMLDRWEPSAKRREPVDMSREMSRVALEVVGCALFGHDAGSKTGEIFDSITEASERAAKMGTFPGLIRPRKRKVHTRAAQAAMERIKSVVREIVAARETKGVEGEDLLGTLLRARSEDPQRMTERLLEDEVLTILLAGSETTATALTWTWYLLANHAEARQRLRDEATGIGGLIPGFADLPRLEYARMVFEESMRLYPPVWFLSRGAIEADEIGGFPVPAKAVLMLCPYYTHRHPDYWPEPHRFDPERFASANVAKRHRFAYFPFAAGPRACIGGGLAMFEAQVVLASVIQRYRPELVTGQAVTPQPLVTLRPRSGVWMKLEQWD